jgi:hypothetical protein
VVGGLRRFCVVLVRAFLFLPLSTVLTFYGGTGSNLLAFFLLFLSRRVCCLSLPRVVVDVDASLERTCAPLTADSSKLAALSGLERKTLLKKTWTASSSFASFPLTLFR